MLNFFGKFLNAITGGRVCDFLVIQTVQRGMFCTDAWRSRLDAVVKEWNPYQMPVGVLEDQRKIGQLILLRKLHNTQHGYAYFEGEILYKEHQDTTYLDHRSRGNLSTQRRWTLGWRLIAIAFSAFDSNGQGGICWCRFCVRCLSNRLVIILRWICNS